MHVYLEQLLDSIFRLTNCLGGMQDGGIFYHHKHKHGGVCETTAALLFGNK